MKFTLRRLLATFAALVLVLAFGTGAAAGPGGDKEAKRPPGPMGMMMMAATAQDIGNEYVAAKIGPDGLFNFGLKPQGAADWYDISYHWPSDPWSSFTTVRIDGADTALGYGGQTEAPANLDGVTNQTAWRFGDVAVRQVIKAGLNPSTGLPDAAEIRYVLTNAGSDAHAVGLRIMIDTMLNGNDGAPFRFPGAAGMEAVTTEREYVGSNVPRFWQAFYDLTNPDISSQWTLGTGGATAPDRMVFAYWGDIYDTLWDYAVTDGQPVTWDSAVGMWWNPISLAPGETRTIVQYYGAPNVGGTATLSLSCPAHLHAWEWQNTPFNVVAYLSNTTPDAFQGVTASIATSLSLPNNDAVHSLGNVPANTSTQTNWAVQALSPGLQTLTVTAEREEAGQMVHVATTACDVDLLPPPVPEGVEVYGTMGEDADGVPVAGRTTPLTVEALFPGAVSVGLAATDGDDTPTYLAGMTAAGGGEWIHTFIPSAKGLWEDPLKITLTPHYADGSTGSPVTFDVHLIDPSGLVYNAAKGLSWVLPDATVTLQYYDTSVEAWVTLTEAAYPGRMVPTTNPQTTGSDGRYAWDVMEGQYRVQVTRAGFAPATSGDVYVPPPVTDLHVGLTPTDAVPPAVSHDGVTNGGTYPGAVTVTISATDELSGVRSVSYSINGGAWTEIFGSEAQFTVSAPGAYGVTYKAVDWAGNEATGQVGFTIGGCTGAPTLSWLPPLAGTNPTAPPGVIPVKFTWTRCGQPVSDQSVSIRVRNAANNTLLSGFTLGAGITYDAATGTYSQGFDTAKYKVTAGTQLKVQVYFGGKLQATQTVMVQ